MSQVELEEQPSVHSAFFRARNVLEAARAGRLEWPGHRCTPRAATFSGDSNDQLTASGMIAIPDLLHPSRRNRC